MCTSILTKAPGEEGVWRESSAAPRQRGEREAPEDTKSVRLHRAQELLELLAAVVFHRRPLRAVVPDAAALDGFRDGSSLAGSCLFLDLLKRYAWVS